MRKKSEWPYARQRDLEQEDDCLTVVRRLDHLLQEASETVQFVRFQQILVEVFQEVYNNACGSWEDGDLSSLSRLVEAMESWVQSYDVGGQPLLLMLLGKAQLATAQSADLTEQLIRQAKSVAVDIYDRVYLLSKVFEFEGNAYFEVDRRRAVEAYRQCLDVCQSESLKIRNKEILEELKVCIVQCHYKLSLLEKIHRNRDGVLQHLQISKRSVTDLLGRQNKLVKQLERTYNEELEVSRRNKMQPKPKLPAKTYQELYNGQVFALQDGRQCRCHLTIKYCFDDSTVDMQMRNQKQGKRFTVELSYPLEVPETKLKNIGEDLSWLSIHNNKLIVSDKQLKKIIGEQQTSRRMFWVVDKKEIFTQRKPGQIGGVLIPSSEDEEEQEQADEEEELGEEESQEEVLPQSRGVPQLPLKTSYLSHQTTFL